MNVTREFVASALRGYPPYMPKSVCSLEESERGKIRENIELFTEHGDVRRLHDIHKDILTIAMRHYRGRTTLVARALGIGRSTLYRNLADFQIQWNETSDQVNADRDE